MLFSFVFLPFLALWHSLTQKFGGFIYGAPQLHMDWSSPHPYHRTWRWDLQMSDSYHWCYTLFQLLWLKSKLPQNSVVSKQHLFYLPVCSVDRAYQGQLVPAPLGISWGDLRTGGWIIWILCSLTRLSSGLGGLEQLGVGAAGHLFILCLCMVTPAWWLHLHEVALGSKVNCPLGERRERIGERVQRARTPGRCHVASYDLASGTV